MLTAALCGLIAAAFAWVNGLRWYWILVIAVAVYVLTGLIQAVGLALLARRRQRIVLRERRFQELSEHGKDVVLREFKRLQEEEKIESSRCNGGLTWKIAGRATLQNGA